MQNYLTLCITIAILLLLLKLGSLLGPGFFPGMICGYIVFEFGHWGQTGRTLWLPLFQQPRHNSSARKSGRVRHHARRRQSGTYRP